MTPSYTAWEAALFPLNCSRAEPTVRLSVVGGFVRAPEATHLARDAGQQLTGRDVFRVDRARARGAHDQLAPCGAVIEQHGPMIGQTPLHVVLEAGASYLAEVKANVGVHGIYRLSLRTDIIRVHHHTRVMWHSMGLGHVLMFTQ